MALLLVFILHVTISQICDQGDLTGKCIELAGLENMLDDLEISDVSLPWQSALQLPLEEEPVSFSI